MSRPTILESRWPDEELFLELSTNWWQELSSRILEAVWSGYDLLAAEVFERLHLDKDPEEAERQITQLLEPRIRQSLTGYELFDCQHGTYENETRLPSPAQPPQYDIAFVLRSNPRLIWPLEAKYVRRSSDASSYVAELRNNFLTGRYAPFSGEAAMVAYLGSGTPEDLWQRVARLVPCEMLPCPNLHNRPQRCSVHNRITVADRYQVSELRCYHLVMIIGAS